MTSPSQLGDEAVLAQVGARMARHRLEKNLTQTALAERAGVSRRTVERLEAGQSLQLSVFLRLLRALDLLDGLDALVPDLPPSPLVELARRGKERRRARKTKATAEPKARFVWGDES